MQGKILDYNDEFKSGLIRGEDGNKYRFSIDDVKSITKPRASAEVDFDPSGDKAVEVYILTKDAIKTIKEATFSAANTTILAVKSPNGIIRKIMQYAIVVSIVIVLISLISVAYDKYEGYKCEENIKTEQAKIKEDNDKAKLLFNDKKYGEALALYMKLSRYTESSLGIAIDKDGKRVHLYTIDDYANFHLMAAECLINLNNPIRANAVIEKVKVSDTLIDGDGEPYQNNLDEQYKAKYYILKAQINALNNEYKFNGVSADFYSANAEMACKYGDCSLIEK